MSDAASGVSAGDGASAARGPKASVKLKVSPVEPAHLRDARRPGVEGEAPVFEATSRDRGAASRP